MNLNVESNISFLYAGMQTAFNSKQKNHESTNTIFWQ